MRSLRRSISLILLIMAAIVPVLGQKTPEYLFPVRGVSGSYSSSYGEMRPNHFHSGVDIRTDKVEGKAVVAVADGYISRITYAPRGFGYALYITHPDRGTMSVYGHLSRLRKDIAEHLTEARYKEQANAKNLFPKATQFPVRQGDIIAYSGNSGSSFGPHLHYELRDTKSGHTLNPVKAGAVKAKDTIAPKILRLHYVVVDTLIGEPKSRLIGSYTPKFENGTYHIDTLVELSGRGYFVVETRDAHNNSSSRFGIYKAVVSIDGKRHFDYRIDRFAFADSRHCNIVSYYPLQRTAKCEVLRLARLPHAPSYLFRHSPTNGIVSLDEGVKAEVEIEITDSSGNGSKLHFSALGTRYLGRPMPKLNYGAVYVGGEREQEVVGEGFSLSLPRNALYEPEYCRTEKLNNNSISAPSVIQLSPIYRIFAEECALNKAVKVRIATLCPTELQRCARIAAVTKEGKVRLLGGEFRNDSVEVQTRRVGDMVVVADTIAPRITARFKEGADMRSGGVLRFSVKDNFSGIADYKLLIDGEWRTLDLQPVKGELVHRFDRPLKGQGVSHSVELEVKDGCGNISTWRGKIIK